MLPSPLFRRNPFFQPSSHRRYEHLSPAQVATWMQYGYVHVPQAFPHEAAAAATQDVWVRLGYNPEDPRTWKETTHLQAVDGRAVKVSEFAPKAWGAICDIAGGADRIEGGADGCWWDDGFIVNLGSDGHMDESVIDGRDVHGWHVDGDFFVHFLDSREQGLLLLVLWGDVIENAGGTVICSDGIGKVARWLYDHPNGVNENLVPLYNGREPEERWYSSEFAEQSTEFFELTGEAGDVYILHPFMIHSAQRNVLRIPRFITNPNITLKQPFNYDRDNPAEYSLIELKTLKDLGTQRLPGWRITGQRRNIEQEYWKENERKKKEQEERIRIAGEMADEQRRLSVRQAPPPIPPRNYLPTYAGGYYAHG